MSFHLDRQTDIILVGAGLSASLFAWTLKQRRPDARIVIFDSLPEAADSKTWSFHVGDVSDQIDLLRPLLAREWSSHAVHFHGFSREMRGAYASIRPVTLFRRMREVLGDDLRMNTNIVDIASDRVRAADGRVYEAPCVIDARGFVTAPRGRLGYQKFGGLHLRLKHPHGMKAPILMDATVAQVDGFRFFYVLPWDDRGLLVEDTRYSDTPDLDEAAMQAEIFAYAGRRGWSVEEIEGRESGVLPIPLDTLDAFGGRGMLGDTDGQVPRIGVGGGLFHPVTGYSLPDGVRMASRLAALEPARLTSAEAIRQIAAYRRERKGDEKFFLLLNRMMFLAAAPERRHEIFSRFYGLSEDLIARFYRGQPALRDKVRVLSGRPPVPVVAAMKAALSRSV
ncbi:MAG: lycopene beta-cyclase CrtY [Calothrix sp. SM1_5_4]|nr:lycopene beta-cyclase CrtY [Calothrix sp. SM1_5_4]